jgi:hypothetical protein
MLKDRGMFAAARRILGLEEDKKENEWLDGTNIQTNEQVNVKYSITTSFNLSLLLHWLILITY